MTTPRKLTIKPTKTYATEANADKAVANKGFSHLRHFMMIEPETGRWFPVFIGQTAMQEGVQYHFNTVA